MGIDAQARVLVTVENEATDTIFNASGLDFDVLKASAIAYINANTLVQKKRMLERSVTLYPIVIYQMPKRRTL